MQNKLMVQAERLVPRILVNKIASRVNDHS
jgi:hypothetical protein